MITLETRKFNLIAAVQLAEFERNINDMPTMNGNAKVLIHTCALEYIEAGGMKYKLGHDVNGDPYLIVANPSEEM